jgi:glyoxylase-like metal-dependent hydrolase (beta-lactamase superfamily II)
MALTIESFVGGPYETNAFLVSDDATKEAIVIDAPMDVAERVDRAAKTAGLTVTLIVITHTHWDHIGDAAEMKELIGAPLAAHKLAVDALANPGSATTELPFTIAPITPDRLLADGDEVTLGEHVFRVLHLPGHEEAHIVLYSEPDRVFLGGDVLFPNGHGRTDIPGADQDTMNRSLARLVDLPPDTIVYPGHGKTTTIGAEAWLQSLRGAS